MISLYFIYFLIPVYMFVPQYSPGGLLVESLAGWYFGTLVPVVMVLILDVLVLVVLILVVMFE